MDSHTHRLYRLQVDIQYAPNVSPPPASFLRQQAYLQGGFLLPPSEDPKGWYNHPDVHFRHHFDTTGPLDCAIALSLAQPLAYTRGTVIPVFISLSGQAPHSLEGLSSLILQPNQPLLELRLCRRIEPVLDALYATTPPGSKGRIVKPVEAWVGPKAVWWKPAGTPASGQGRCDIEGEIHLEGDLEPSCTTPFLSIVYFVKLISRAPERPGLATASSSSLRSPLRHASSGSSSMHNSSPSKSPAHRSHNSVSSELASIPVTITTFHVHGPLPTPFTIAPKANRSKSGALSDTLAGRRYGNRRSISVEDVFGEGGSFEKGLQRSMVR